MDVLSGNKAVARRIKFRQSRFFMGARYAESQVNAGTMFPKTLFSRSSAGPVLKS